MTYLGAIAAVRHRPGLACWRIWYARQFEELEVGVRFPGKPPPWRVLRTVRKLTVNQPGESSYRFDSCLSSFLVGGFAPKPPRAFVGVRFPPLGGGNRGRMACGHCIRPP